MRWPSRERDLEPVRDVQDRVLLVVGYAGGVRRSELAQLTPQNLAFGPQGVEVTLKRSKTDQHGEGRVVELPPGPRQLCESRLESLIDHAQTL